MRLVDLSGRDHNGYQMQVVVNPEHITAMVDESGSYYQYTLINLAGGKTVRVPHRLSRVRQLLSEDNPCQE